MPEFDPTSEKQLIEAIKIAASQALAEEQWILCATLCRTIEELMIKNVVAGGAERAFEALKQTTVAVPLIGRTRPETPRQQSLRGSIEPAGRSTEPYAYARCLLCEKALEALGWHQPSSNSFKVEWTDWRHIDSPAVPADNLVNIHEPDPVSVRPTAAGWTIIQA